MRDVVMLLVITGFFALCVAYVGWCDHIIGRDPVDAAERETVDAADEHAATEVAA